MKQPFILPGAVVVGDVQIAEQSSIWYHAVVRGDCSKITIGKKTNIQDGAILHSDRNNPLTIGSEVTIGHGAIIHGCTISDRVLIGMGAIVMNGAVIGRNCMIGAGALVTQGTIVPEGTLWIGSPARQARTLSPEEIKHIPQSALEYLKLALLHCG